MTIKARITRIGNSMVIRLPKKLVLSLGTTEIILVEASDGVLIKPVATIPPLNQWSALFTEADTSLEQEFNDWDVTLNDGRRSLNTWFIVPCSKGLQ